MRGDGRVFSRSGRWWIAYYAPKDGRRVEHREPAVVSDGEGRPPRPAKNEAEARRLLKARRREVAVHETGLRQFQGPAQERVLFSDLLDGVERDYRVRGLRSLPQLRSHLVHVRGAFGQDKALAVTSERLQAYVEGKQREGLKPATIQRHMEVVRRAFGLAAAQKTVTFTPVVPTLKLENARQGFLSRADFEAVLAQLGELRGRGKAKKLEPDGELRDFVEWAWWSGMRRGEISKLTWEGFDKETWTLRLHAKDAKTGRGRVLGLAGPLRTIMTRRVKARLLDVPYIFHRYGAQVGDFGKAWDTACKRAKLPGVLFHDLRRSAIRNMVRGGVDPAVAMKISGHRTRSVFDRYNIVSEEDLRAAMLKTEDYVSTLPTERTVDTIRKTGG